MAAYEAPQTNRANVRTRYRQLLRRVAFSQTAIGSARWKMTQPGSASLRVLERKIAIGRNGACTVIA
jgi:hypothetical protein